MIIDRRNTKFGEQIVLISDEGKIIVNGDIKAKVVYLGKGNRILDWKEIEDTLEKE